MTPPRPARTPSPRAPARTPSPRPPVLTADDALDRIEDDVARARRRAEVAQGVQQQVAAVRGTGRARGGEVVAVTDASGRLLDLRLAPGVLQAGPTAVARAVLAAVRDAETRATDQTLTLAAEAFGADSGVLHRLRTEIDERLSRDISAGTSPWHRS